MVSRRYLGTSEIARICQVTSVTVGNWIRSGKLKASRVPGGNYRVTAADLVRFLQDSGMVVPSGLIDQQPRAGAHGTRIAFIHPKGSGGVLTELCEVTSR